jgi:lipopolysaccharide biosynthesis protein
MYLPQFHPIPENDEWWGKGFTEWTNVVKAKPLFKGHYQPHLPTDLGFYDLRLEETRIAQAKLAKEHGIYGFCYYHYWFNGKQILERPFREVFETGKPDFPFMLCWANENWTKKWDGQEDHILLKQDYSDEDDKAHIRSLLPYFKDSRYIKVNGKPVFAIYRSSLLPDAARTINTWRNEAMKEGIELYLCRFESFKEYGRSFTEAGFDAAIEFQPHSKKLDEYSESIQSEYKLSSFKNRLLLFVYTLTKQQDKYDDHITNLLFEFQKHMDYNAFVDHLIATYKFTNEYVLFPGASPSWDNTARRGIKAFFLTNSNPLKFKEWLIFMHKNFKPPSAEENFVFINAWNEWAEGCHLEPCQKWGTGYLKAVKDVFG